MGTNARSVGLSLKRRLDDLYTQIAGLKAAADTWTLDGDDNLLPSDATIKTAIEVYEGLSFVPLRLSEEIQEIKAGESEPLPELPPVPVAVNTEWASIQNTPATFPPATHDHTTADITDLPATFPPATHDHTTADITDLPATFPPATHDHTTADITDLPATFPPATHDHTTADITDLPATFPPATHTHAYTDLTSTPATFAPRMAFVTWTGNGNTTRVIAFSGGFIAQGVIVTTGGGAYARINGTGFTADTENSLTITSAGSMNVSGTGYYCLIFG